MHTREDIFQEIRRVLVQLFEIDESIIALDATLGDDLDIDSIDAVDLLAELREFTKRYSDFTGDAQPRHCVMNVLVELDGPDRAHADCYLVMTHAEGDKTQLVVSGRYEDRIVREGGAWRFAEVKVHPDHGLDT